MREKPEFGPAMAALTDRQRRFVIAMVEQPGMSFAKAARAAGYSDVKEGAKVTGHLLAHRPSVQAAIREEAGKRLHAASLIAANVVVDVMTDPEAPRKEKLKAASMILDRTGFAASQNINVNQTIRDESSKAIMERIERAAAALGVDAATLLGVQPMKVIEHGPAEKP